MIAPPLSLSTDALVGWLNTHGDSARVIYGTFELLQPGNLAAIEAAAAGGGQVLALIAHDNTGERSVDDRLELLHALRAISATCVVGPEPPDRLREAKHWSYVSCPDADDAVGRTLATWAPQHQTLPLVPGCRTADVRAAIANNTTPIPVPYPAPVEIYDAAPRAAGTVTVNGCFDILHTGHLRFLQAARDLGTALVMVINDDASVARYKGATRPIFPLAFRQRALAATRAVDQVVAFSQDNPLDTLRDLRPSIHAKGGTFEPERVRDEQQLLAEWGGRVAFCELVEGYSTTRYIEGVAD